MMNNPMMMIMQMMQGGGMNPQQMMQQMMGMNPQFAQIMQTVNPNDPRSMEQMCKNICQQKGVDFNTMLAQFKQQTGMK